MARDKRKPWESKKKSGARNIENRGDEKELFLIVCEGEKTEPNYFKQFRVSSAKVIVKGTGYNTISLVEEACRLRKKYFKAEDLKFDQTWCVLDRDSFSANTFNRALKLAEDKEIKIAYSNEAFELWYLLHFQYFDTALSRKRYGPLLKKYLGRSYKKNDTSMYAVLLDKQKTAILNAEKLLKQYRPCNPEDNNPSTKVVELVKELNRFNNSKK